MEPSIILGISAIGVNEMLNSLQLRMNLNKYFMAQKINYQIKCSKT